MTTIVTHSGKFLDGESCACDPEASRALERVWLKIAGWLTPSLVWACIGLPAEAALTQAPTAPVVSASAPTSVTAPAARWMTVPRLAGRITAKDLGLVINTADPYSLAVGDYYIKARKLAPQQVLRLQLPVRAALSADEFQSLSARIAAAFGPATQALALAWVTPYAVNCNAITGALALGYDAGLCAHTCAASRVSRYFNAATLRPFTELKMRPSMLLAARDVVGAKAMIDRGVAADRSLGLRGGMPAQAYFVNTLDRARSARSELFPPAGPLRRLGVDVHIESTQAIERIDRLFIYETGLPRVDKLDTLKWLPGALADHLTSYGGQLTADSGQMSALDWIAAGATASYGTVSEPCSHVQKFPHPQILLQHYVQGSSALEAYWKSVAWPQQGVFIGEPLAAPFARR